MTRLPLLLIVVYERSSPSLEGYDEGVGQASETDVHVLAAVSYWPPNDEQGEIQARFAVHVCHDLLQHSPICFTTILNLRIYSFLCTD